MKHHPDQEASVSYDAGNLATDSLEKGTAGKNGSPHTGRPAACLLLIFIVGPIVIGTAFCGYIISTADDTVRRASLLFESGLPDEAADELSWLSRLKYRSGNLDFLTGRIRLQKGDIEGAAAAFARIRPSEAQFADARHRLAGCHLETGNLVAAEDILQLLVSESTPSINASRELSHLLLGQLRSIESTEVLLRCLKSHSQAPVETRIALLKDLIVSQYIPPLPDECLPNLRRAYKQNPEQESVQVALAACLIGTDEIHAADQLLDRVLSLNPECSRAWLLKLESAVEKGDLGSADAILNHLASPHFNSVLNALSREPEFWLIQCRIREGRGEFDEARKLLEESQRYSIWGRASLARSARLHQRTGLRSEAEAMYRKLHRWAEAELEASHLFKEFRHRLPTEYECNRFTRLLITLEKPAQAAAWREASSLLASGRPRPIPSTLDGYP